MTTPEEREAMEWAEKKATEWEGLATHFHRLNQAFAHEMHAAEAARWRTLLALAQEAIERWGAWQSIATAPKDETAILVWINTDDNDEQFNVAIAAFRNKHWFDVSTGGWGEWFQPTRWMPLPPPPGDH